MMFVIFLYTFGNTFCVEIVVQKFRSATSKCNTVKRIHSMLQSESKI